MPLPASANLEHLRKQAKELLAALRVNDPFAHARWKAFHPEHSPAPSASAHFAVSLSEAQFVIAREYGFASWPRLKRHVESLAATRQARTTEAPAQTASSWDALLRADPVFARLTDAQRQAILPVQTAQWRETSTRWDAPGGEEYSRQMQEWIRFYPPAHAWRSDDDEDWSHDVMDERGHLHTASSWDMCCLLPQANPLTAEDLLRRILFWPPEHEEGAALSVLRPRDAWQQEQTEVDGRPLIRWYRETTEHNFRVAQSIWTEAATHRITRKERREISFTTGRDVCFVVSDQYVYNAEPPARTFEMPPDKPIVLGDAGDTSLPAWDTFSAKQKQAVRKIINQSDAGWRNADFAAFASVWSFGMTGHLPPESEWQKRVRQQQEQWREWRSEIETADTQTYLPVTVTTDSATLMTVEDEVLRVEVKLRVAWGEAGGEWEGHSDFFLRRKGRSYEIVHWECPWGEIEAARNSARTP